MSDEELIEMINILRSLAWVSRWHRDRLSEALNESILRKLNV